jgi:hypothetical protein
MCVYQTTLDFFFLLNALFIFAFVVAACIYIFSHFNFFFFFNLLHPFISISYKWKGITGENYLNESFVYIDGETYCCCCEVQLDITDWAQHIHGQHAKEGKLTRHKINLQVINLPPPPPFFFFDDVLNRLLLSRKSIPQTFSQLTYLRVAFVFRILKQNRGIAKSKVWSQSHQLFNLNYWWSRLYHPPPPPPPPQVNHHRRVQTPERQLLSYSLDV